MVHGVNLIDHAVGNREHPYAEDFVSQQEHDTGLGVDTGQANGQSRGRFLRDAEQEAPNVVDPWSGFRAERTLPPSSP